MRISLSRKIFWLFLPLATISLLYGVIVYYGLNGIELTNNRISQLKDFQLQLKELKAWQVRMAIPHDTGFHEDFELEISKTKKMVRDIMEIQDDLPRDLRLRMENLPFFMDNFNRAFQELYERYETDQRFPKENGELFDILYAKSNTLKGMVDPQRINSFKGLVHRLPELQIKIYHHRDTSHLPKLKKIRREMATLIDNPEMLTIVDQFIANLEANYIHYLGIEDRNDFLNKSSHHFFQVSAETIQAVERKNKTIKRISLWVVIAATSLAVLLNLLCWLYSSRYVRRFLVQQRHLVQSIKSGDSALELTSLPDDEIGDLTRTLSQVILDCSQAVNKLQMGEERYHTLFNSSADGLVVYSLEGIILEANDAYLRMMGYSHKELIGKPLIDMVHPEHRVDVEYFNQQSKVLEDFRLESVNVHRDGTPIPIEVRGNLTKYNNQPALLGIVRDITRRKQMEEDRARLMSAIEQAFETVVISDPEGIIQYVNPAFEKLTGYSSEEAIGQHSRFLGSGEQDKAFFEKMWSTLRQGKIWNGHFINRKKDGSVYEEEATISPVKNSVGQIINFVAVKHDVTEKILLEKQLRQAMKMEAIGTLAGGIAHDFNNILAAILGYSEIARAQLSAEDKIGKNLDQVIKAGHRAAELVKQILTFSRQGEESFQIIKVQPIIQEVLQLLRSSLPATILIKESIMEESGPILADPAQIHQVLMNLCTNAKQSIASNIGRLSVSLSEVEVADSSTIANCPQIKHGTYLDLTISDTGCGMDRLTQSKIFDPFFTTKETGIGTGLGLSVVHGIIKQYKGEITVSSELGQGTTFHIYLPVIEEEMPAERVAIKEPPRGSERILFVDDETVIVHMTEQILTGLGYSVTGVTSSIEALDVYKNNPDDFDLVITDMTMPEMTGADLTRKLLALRPDLPVIVCTGHNETIDEAQAKSFGIREYLLKPADTYTLAIAIRRALRPS